MLNVPHEIIVHHEGVSRTYPSLDIVNESHRRRDFPRSALGYFVGYHYLIERDGKLIACREEWETGAHTIEHNLSSIGIGLAGNFDTEYPTSRQQQTLGNLLGVLVHRYKIPATRIVPHRAFANKSCYGSQLDSQWAARMYIRYEVSRLSQLVAMLRLQLKL